jgi:hypothetical protein
MAVNTSDLTALELPSPANAGTGLTDVINQAAENLYNYEQDTNRLARGVATGTVVDIKDSTRRKNIPVAASIDTWEEPLSPYGASYPHNSVYQTPNGLIQEFDDTPNNVRYHRYHPSGTYTEVDANGTEVRKIVGDNFYIIENNGYIFIGGEANITISGKCNIMVMNDCNLQVDGKLDAVVKNDINLSSSGSLNLNVKETFKIKADEVILETNKFSHNNVGDMKVKSATVNMQAENIDTAVSESYKLSTKNHNVTASENSFLNAVDINNTASGKIAQQASGKISLNSGDVVLGNGGTVNINAGSLKATTTAKETQGNNLYPVSTAGPASPDSATAALSAVPQDPALTGFVIPANRANPDRSPRPALGQISNRVIRSGIENDDGTRSSVPLYPGYNTSPPYVPDSSLRVPDNISRVESTPVDSSAILNKVGFSGEEQLSKYIKLKDVTTNAIFGHRLKAQAGLTEGQIAANLQALSVNVLDRMVEKYGRGSFIITSAFRPGNQAKGGQGLSQHGFGQAVDIQFPTLPSSEYAARAQELLSVIPFDQLLLEYQSTGSGRPWIHISFSNQGNRRQYFTMFNHQRTTPIMTA